jgi:hypothetical protein
VHRLLLALLLPLAGCSGLFVSVGGGPFTGIEQLFSAEYAVPVVSVGRSQHCGTDGEATRVTLLPDGGAVQAWQRQRGLNLTEGVPLDLPHAVVELGLRGSTGHGFAISQSGAHRGDWVLLRATTFEPAPGAAVATPSTPCALVQLPQGPWAGVRVYNQAGAVIAQAPNVD